MSPGPRLVELVDELLARDGDIDVVIVDDGSGLDSRSAFDDA